MPYKDPDKQREFGRRWTAARRKEWFDANGPCVDCGSWENLELDHVDARLKVSHNVWSWREERRLAELAKCVVRCHTDHVEKTKRSIEVTWMGTRGEDHPAAKFSVEDIKLIRASTLRTTDLAEQYGVYTATISKIRKGQRWKSVPL